MRVLIADDSSLVRERLVRLLGDVAGVEVREAGSAAEVFAAVLDFRPQAVLLDICMSGCDGMRVLQRIRRLAGASRVIVLTNCEIQRCRRACLAAGAEAFFDKSAEFAEAIGAVRRLCGEVRGSP